MKKRIQIPLIAKRCEKTEQIGRAILSLSVTHNNRFMVHINVPHEPSWSRTRFFSNYDEAKWWFYEWRNAYLKMVALEALGLEP